SAVRSSHLLCERGWQAAAAPAPTSQLRGPPMKRVLDRVWFVPIPGLRLAVLRVLICAFALVWLVGFAPILLSGLWFPPERFEPIGVVTLLDRPLAPVLGVVIWLLTVIAGVATLLGWRFRMIAPVFAIGLLWVTSYRNSWG